MTVQAWPKMTTLFSFSFVSLSQAIEVHFVASQSNGWRISSLAPAQGSSENRVIHYFGNGLRYTQFLRRRAVVDY